MNTQLLDLRQSCEIYSNSIRSTMQNLFDIDLKIDSHVEKTNHLAEDEDIYFSIFFTGQVYGELLIGINRKIALDVLNIPYTDKDAQQVYWDNRETVMDTFKEIINIAAGQALSHLKVAYPQVTITPPRATEGKLSLADFEFAQVKLSHQAGKFSCYMYVDQMKLDIATTLEQGTVQREELKRLNKAKTEFLANMSHELRTPLNGMIGMVDILKTTNLTRTQSEQLSIISRSGDFLLSIINEILEFSKIESGKIEIEDKEFDIRSCIEKVGESLSHEVYRKNLEFFITLASDLPKTLVSDPTRLSQVLMNLLGNAIKFTPTGSIKIDAKLKDAENLVIEVIDSGVGIPKNKIETIFDSFSQADVSDNRRYGGSGLGLSISKSIIEKMNGSLTVASTESIGSTFTICIPIKSPQPLSKCDNSFNIHFHEVGTENQSILNTYLKQIPTQTSNLNMEWHFVSFSKLKKLTGQDFEMVMSLAKNPEYAMVFLVRPQDLAAWNDLAEMHSLESVRTLKLPILFGDVTNLLNQRIETQNLKPDQKIQTETAIQKLSGENKMLKVLLVEDNPVNQMVAKTMLEKMNYQVITANHGEEAVEFYQNQEFDLILMDCQMPIMNGYQAARRIRELEENKTFKTPIIALTANAFKETKEQCFESGMNDFATKPIKLESLQQVIDRVLQAE